MVNDEQLDSLILASGSPRRRELLERMGLRFEVFPAQVEEWEAEDAPPAELVLHNAVLKAEWVMKRRPGELVLASDTTVAIDGCVLNKPIDWADARRMLMRLSGNTHTVYTAIVLFGESLEVDIREVVSSDVTFKELNDKVIDNYFQRVNPLDKAGAYGIQEGRELIIASLNGSLTNVMGLPTEYLEQVLHQTGLWEKLIIR